MLRVFVSVSLLLSAVSATFFQDCGSIGSEVILNIEDCDLPPCLLARGEEYTLNILFTSSKTSAVLEIEASAYIAGINIPWPGIDTDGCKQLVATSNSCPYDEGSRVDWTMEVPVLKDYPAISTVVTFKLNDDNGDSQACTVVPVTLV